jgi:hypothetical protein
LEIDTTRLPFGNFPEKSLSPHFPQTENGRGFLMY